jgi:hypothetical protein
MNNWPTVVLIIEAVIMVFGMVGIFNILSRRERKKDQYYTLVANQALEIDNLKREVADYKTRMKNIRMILYWTGGPLNGNIVGYGPGQFGPFFQIAEETEGGMREEKEEDLAE